MEVLTWIFSVLKTVPGWVWVIGLICILAPTASYFLKRSAKVVMIICAVAVCLFVFPSIGTAFMDTAGLVYDAETNKLTNSAGQTITLKLPDIEGLNESNATDTALGLVEMAKKVIKNFDKDELQNVNITDIKLKVAELFGKVITDEEAQAIKQILDFSVTDN